jgi:hypothetical protein
MIDLVLGISTDFIDMLPVPDELKAKAPPEINFYDKFVTTVAPQISQALVT